MTDESNLQTQDMVAPPVSAPAENMVPQSRVNEIVHQRTAAAKEVGRREALEEFARTASHQSASSMGGVSQGISQDEIRRIAAEESQKHLETLNRQHAEASQQYQAQKTVDEFVGKMKSADTKYPGLYDKFAKYAGSMPHIIHMVNQTENSGDVMNELLGNPQKLANLNSLYHMNPQFALDTTHGISASIKVNDAGKNQRQASEPLSHLAPSTTGTDSGVRSVKDMRNDPLYRG